MNYCRTCKYWSCNSGMIGFGVCLNVYARFLLGENSKEFFQTAQNFGCVKHSEGNCDSELDSKETQLKEIKDFLLDRYDIAIDDLKWH